MALKTSKCFRSFFASIRYATSALKIVHNKTKGVFDST